MKKQLIAGLVASVIMSNAGVANASTEIKETPKATPKAKVAVSNFKTFKDHIIERLEEFEAEQEAERLRLEQERLRLEAEEKARKEEEARRAGELRLELERQASVGFDSMDVTRKSNLRAYELENVLYNVTNGDGLAPYASYFIEAEEIYGINAFFICALAAQESGWGRYAAGNGTNLTGYAVYNHGYEGTTFEGGIRHNILATAELIADKYVNPDGPYHTEWDGYNYGKSIYEINVKYCLKTDMATTDFDWSNNIGRIANMLARTYHSIR